MTPMAAPDLDQKMRRRKDRVFLSVPAAPEHVRALRSAAAEYLRRLCWSERDISDFVLAIGEAGNNAACYGTNGTGGTIGTLGPPTISLECHRSRDNAVVVEIRNRGTFSPPVAALSDTFPEWQEIHGRGLALMRALVDQVEILQAAGITTVRLTKANTRQ